MPADIQQRYIRFLAAICYSSAVAVADSIVDGFASLQCPAAHAVNVDDAQLDVDLWLSRQRRRAWCPETAARIAYTLH
jgi:hypothetical protein